MTQVRCKCPASDGTHDVTSDNASNEQVMKRAIAMEQSDDEVMIISWHAIDGRDEYTTLHTPETIVLLGGVESHSTVARDGSVLGDGDGGGGDGGGWNGGGKGCRGGTIWPAPRHEQSGPRTIVAMETAGTKHMRPSYGGRENST